MKSNHRHHFLLTSLALCALITITAHAIEPTVQKLFTKNIVTQAAPQGASSVAISDKWILVSEPLNTDKGLNAGTVHVFSATTKLEVRKLTGLDTAAGDFFGRPCLIRGDTAFIGADGNGGKAYAFNLLTGVQLKKFVPTDLLLNGDLFGYSIAISGNTLVVGAPFRTTLGIKSGAAYFFDLRTGLQTQRVIGINPESNDFFGSSIAAEGGLVVIGAPFSDQIHVNDGVVYVYDLATAHLISICYGETMAGDVLGMSVAISGNTVFASAIGELTSTGSVYLFDATNGNQLNHLTASDGATEDSFGSAIAVSDNLLVIGAEGQSNSTGAAYTFDWHRGLELRKLTANDAQDQDDFSHTISVCGNDVLIGAPGDDDAGVDFGAAYLFQNIAAPLPMKSVVAKDSFAPASAQTTFAGFTEAVLNQDHEIIISATLAGLGTAGGKTKGIWSNFTFDTHLMHRLTDSVAPNVKIADLSKPLFNNGSLGYYRARLTGIGITTLNDNVIFKNDGSDFGLVRSEGTDAHGRLASFNEVAQNFDAIKAGIAMTQTYTVGFNGIIANTDSTLQTLVNGNLGHAISESGNSQSIAGVKYGQLSGRVAYTGTEYAWSCALQGGNTTQNAAVFKNNAEIAIPTDTLIARKGVLAPDSGQGAFSAFMGESISTQNSVLIRATLSGVGVTAANNEALFSTSAGGLHAVAREAAPAPGLPTPIVFSTFPKIWATGGVKDQVAMQATLRGRGITAANDQSLWVLQENFVMLMLMREGDAAPGCCDGAKIGTILRIEMEPNAGRYAILATLVGGTVGKDLALFVGQTDLGDPAVQSGLRLPALKLRKGTIYQSTLGTTSKLKTIAFPTTGLDAVGAGNKGLGECLNASGGLSLFLGFDDLSIVVANGKL